MNIYLKIHNSCLKEKTESEVLLDLVFHLWDKKLTSYLYRILVNFGLASGGLKFASMDKSMSDLFLSILGLNHLGLNDNTNKNLDIFICSNNFNMKFDEEFEDCMIESLSEINMCVVLLNQDKFMTEINTYEKRIDLPFSCGRRDGIHNELIVSEKSQNSICIDKAAKALYCWRVVLGECSKFNLKTEINYSQGDQHICLFSHELIMRGFNQIRYSKADKILNLFFNVWGETKNIIMMIDSQIEDISLYAIKETWGS